jgi:GTPase SAR1 family protein
MGCNASKPAPAAARDDGVIVVGPRGDACGADVGVHKVVVLGDVAVGKTSLAHRFVHGTFDEAHKATVPSGLFVVVVGLGPDHNNRQVTLRIWDTAGQEEFHNVCLVSGAILCSCVRAQACVACARTSLNLPLCVTWRWNAQSLGPGFYRHATLGLFTYEVSDPLSLVHVKRCVRSWVCVQ